VTCQQGLQFFPDRAAAVAHTHRVLRPGGRIALAAWRDIECHPFMQEMSRAQARHLGSVGVSYEDVIAPWALGSADALRSLLENAGFTEVEVSERSFEVCFPSPDTFARTVSQAYAAVIPQFVEDPAAFEEYVSALERDTRDIVRAHTRGNGVVTQWRTHLAFGHA